MAASLSFGCVALPTQRAHGLLPNTSSLPEFVSEEMVIIQGKRECDRCWTHSDCASKQWCAKTDTGPYGRWSRAGVCVRDAWAHTTVSPGGLTGALSHRTTYYEYDKICQHCFQNDGNKMLEKNQYGFYKTCTHKKECEKCVDDRQCPSKKCVCDPGMYGNFCYCVRDAWVHWNGNEYGKICRHCWADGNWPQTWTDRCS